MQQSPSTVNAVTVSPIRALTSGGFAWTVTDPSYSDSPRHFETNEKGYGLWRGDKQILGTSQFNLNCSPGARRARVLRFFND